MFLGSWESVPPFLNQPKIQHTQTDITPTASPLLVYKHHTTDNDIETTTETPQNEDINNNNNNNNNNINNNNTDNTPVDTESLVAQFLNELKPYMPEDRCPDIIKQLLPRYILKIYL